MVGLQITPCSPSGEVFLPPNPRRTHGRSGRAAVTAGTLSTVGDDVAGEDVKRYVKGRDADRDDANVMHPVNYGGCPHRTWKRGVNKGARIHEWRMTRLRERAALYTPEPEFTRLARLRRWQATR